MQKFSTEKVHRVLLFAMTTATWIAAGSFSFDIRGPGSINACGNTRRRERGSRRAFADLGPLPLELNADGRIIVALRGHHVDPHVESWWPFPPGPDGARG